MTEKFGCIMANDVRYHHRVKVYLDGEDVTDGCVEADDQQGYVKLWTGVDEARERLICKTLWGNVCIEWRSEDAAEPGGGDRVEAAG